METGEASDEEKFGIEHTTFVAVDSAVGEFDHDVVVDEVVSHLDFEIFDRTIFADT